MGLHFAYGSNMDRAAMTARCPAARPEGRARLDGWRFLINEDGYATVTPSPGSVVHGVVWRLTASDRAALDAYEDLESGLYTVQIVPVWLQEREVPAMIYVGRSRLPGVPLPGYLGAVMQAARDWDLPEDYIRSMAHMVDVRPPRSA